MKVLNIPHQTAEYLCPINGICDIYQWKTGVRIPEALLFHSNVGLSYISNKRSQPKELIFLNGSKSIGKRQYEFWANHIGYELIYSEGRTFKTVLSRLVDFIEADIPIILFGLDMYYLEYQEKYYKNTHILGHVVLMIGYDEHHVLVLDNSKEEIQKISIFNLEKAWSTGYLGISKKNCFFAIKMDNPQLVVDNILASAYDQICHDYFNSPIRITGEKAYHKLHEKIPLWKEKKGILNHIYTYTGSTLPENYLEKRKGSLGIVNFHRAGRDKFSDALIKYAPKSKYQEKLLVMANEFSKSAVLVESISQYCFCVLDNSQEFEEEKLLQLFDNLKIQEEKSIGEMKFEI